MNRARTLSIMCALSLGNLEPAGAEPAPTALCFRLESWAETRCALVDSDGGLLRPPDLQHVLPFTADGEHGLIAAARHANGRWGYLDQNGVWMVPPDLDAAYAHAPNGLARFARQGKWGYIDLRGEEVIPPQYDAAAAFRDGLATVRTKRGWGYVKADGSFAIEPRFDDAGAFAGKPGLAAVRFPDSKRWGYVARNGEVVIPGSFVVAGSFGPDDRAVAAVKGRLGLSYGVIDASGNWLLSPRYRDLRAFNSEGLAYFEPAAEQWDSWNYRTSGYLDREFRIVMAADFIAHAMNCGLVRQGYETIRFLKADGSPAFKSGFSWASDFAANCVAVALDRDRGQWGLVHSDGSFIPLAEGYREPLTTADRWLFGFWQGRGLLPVLTVSGGVAWIDDLGEEQYRLEIEAGADTTRSRLLDRQGTVLWAGDPAFRQGSEPTAAGPGDRRSEPERPLAFLNQGPGEHFIDAEAWSGDLVARARRLLAAPAREFGVTSLVDYPPDFSSDRPDPYDLAEILDEFGYSEDEVPELLDEYYDEEALYLVGAVYRGAVEILAEAYIGEADWGRYYYLDASLHQRFKGYFETLRRRLTEALGKPEILEVSGHAVWRIAGRILILAVESSDGDGDFSWHLVLAGVEARS